MRDEIQHVFDEFPDYTILSSGHVFNHTTNRGVHESRSKSGGELKVNLRDESGFYRTMSIKRLIAEAFVPGKTEIFNTPIQLDWDITNNSAENLAWRPRWFAHLYRLQASWYDFDDDLGAVVDSMSGMLYMSVLEASQVNGVLIRDVIRSVSTDQSVFPTGQVYQLVKSAY